MSQCVPHWDHNESPDLPSSLPSTPHPNCTPPNLSMLEDYEVAELTWKDGQLSMHGLGTPRISAGRKPLISSKYTSTTLDDKLCAAGGGTLESIVNQAAQLQPIKTTIHRAGKNLDVPWFNDHHQHADANTTPTTTLEVPSSTRTCSNDVDNSTLVPKLGTVVGRGGHNKHVREDDDEEVVISRKRKSFVGQVPVISHDGSTSRDQSVTGSENSSRKESNWQVTLDAYDMAGFTSASLGSVPENTVSSWESFKEGGGTTMEEDEKKGKEREKSSGSTRRSRAAAIHNQSERKRRDKINQRMKTLQKLVPNSNKTDKASMLDEVIEYIKQLQAQVQTINGMSMAATAPHIMIPPAMITMQQQLQLHLMAQMCGLTQMGMGPGMAAGMLDLSSMAIGRHHPNIPSFLHPTAVMPDPLSTLLATQSQISKDTYSRMAALYQQLNQTQTPVVPNSNTY